MKAFDSKATGVTVEIHSITILSLHRACAYLGSQNNYENDPGQDNHLGLDTTWEAGIILTTLPCAQGCGEDQMQEWLGKI